MNAETGSEPESPKKRGRIPQSAWPQILERYRSGVTLSAIAREFECTPSAISYIIKKAEAASGQGDAAHGDAGAEGMGAEGMQDEAQAAADTSSAAPETVGEAAAPVTPAVPETPAPAAPAAAEAGTPAEPRRAAGRTGRTTLTRAPRTEPATEQASAETPAAAPAPTETLRLNRPEPAAAPAPAPVAAPAPAQSPVQAPAAPETPRAPGQPTPPVDAVEGRLRDTAKACISAYRGWRQQPSEATIQALSETVHELRKALARVEIDMSASRREEQAIRPIPIPAHRASRRPN
ncbi:hypothetical protein E6C67_09510 [Azospirillum sp. TSA2s]|nr:hypothetical protein E6C67_09510 [Azospirillum sp. TSA2s]